MFLVRLHSFTVCFINISIIKPLYVSSVISHELIKHPQTASRPCVCVELSFIHCVHVFMLSFVSTRPGTPGKLLTSPGKKQNILENLVLSWNIIQTVVLVADCLWLEVLYNVILSS